MRLDPCALSNNTDLIRQMRQYQGNADMTAELQVVPARCGRAVRLAKGQAIQIINTHGQQVVDTWCFNACDLSEFMSMEHLHASLEGIFPTKGDGLATNRRRPILVLEEDTSPGRHDTRRAYDPVQCLTAEEIAEGIFWALNKPAHLCVNELEIVATEHVIGGVRYKGM